MIALALKWLVRIVFSVNLKSSFTVSSQRLINHKFPGIHQHHHQHAAGEDIDRKSTRLNSSHGYISYAVFCLKKKNTTPLSSTYDVLTSGVEYSTVQLLATSFLHVLLVSHAHNATERTHSDANDS